MAYVTLWKWSFFKIIADLKALHSISWVKSPVFELETTQPAFTCSKLTIETLEQGVKYVQN